MSKTTIIDQDNSQGRFEKALRILSEKLTSFRCPICHSQEGLTFYSEPMFVMHYDWDTTTDPYSLQAFTGSRGRASVLAVCKNCGYDMLFDANTVANSTKPFEIRREEK